jgi:epoxyqueuosine reductase
LRELEEIARRLGADLFGICDLAKLRGLQTVPEDLLHGFEAALSVGLALRSDAIESISDRPSPAYAKEYKRANRALDTMTQSLVSALAQQGRRGLAIPASETLDRRNHLGAISHRALARAAGLGWIGKSLLLITPQYGPRVRLATILCDLRAGEPAEMDALCGDCVACIDACPANALREPPQKTYPPRRSDVLDLEACRNQCKKLAPEEQAGVEICGVCVKVCPAGL